MDKTIKMEYNINALIYQFIFWGILSIKMLKKRKKNDKNATFF